MPGTISSPRQLLTYAGVAAIIVLADPAFPTFVAGSALAAVGVALRVWATGHLRKNQELITSGPYAHVKHPMYLGTFLITLGGVIAAGSPTMPSLLIWAFVGPAFLLSFFAYYLPKKRHIEGNRLQRTFPDGFDEFNRSVPDFVPSLRPFTSASQNRWKFKNVRHNHELEMDALIAGLFCLIFIGGLPLGL